MKKWFGFCGLVVALVATIILGWVIGGWGMAIIYALDAALIIIIARSPQSWWR